MQRDKNLVYINNGQQIDAIHMGYHKTGAVYTWRSGLLEVTPDRTPIRPELESVLTLTLNPETRTVNPGSRPGSEKAKQTHLWRVR